MMEERTLLRKARGELKDCVSELQYNESPYHDSNAKEHKFHAVIRTGDDIAFLSAPTADGLKVGLSSLSSVKKVIAIYEGQLLDFSETRALAIKGIG